MANRLKLATVLMLAAFATSAPLSFALADGGGKGEAKAPFECYGGCGKLGDSGVGKGACGCNAGETGGKSGGAGETGGKSGGI